MTYQVFTKTKTTERVQKETRRFNGALAEQQALVESNLAMLRRKAGPADRVVQGPVDDKGIDIGVVLIGPMIEHTIVIGIRRK